MIINPDNIKCGPIILSGNPNIRSVYIMKRVEAGGSHTRKREREEMEWPLCGAGAGGSTTDCTKMFSGSLQIAFVKVSLSFI